MNLAPLAIQKFFDNNGRPLVSGKLFTYVSGTSTKIATYKNAAGTLNTNPIILNFRGECRLWIDPTLSYTFVLSPRNDTDPPTDPIWTVDDITAGPAQQDNAANDTGSVNNIELSIPQISSPVAFTRIVFKVANTNTGPVTISINGGTSKALTWQSTAPFVGGEIIEDAIYEAIYDGARWQLQGPAIASWTTALETAAVVTPQLFNILSNDDAVDLDVRRHGLKESKSEAQNAAAIASTISVLQETSAAGGVIRIPPGKFNCDPILVPERVTLKGAGQLATWLTNGDSGNFITLGSLANTGVLKYGCGLRDIALFCNHRNGNAIYMRELAGAVIQNIYAENNGRTGNTDTGTCVTIDGGDVSTFFNVLTLVISNHWHYNYRILTTGSVIPTQSTFIQCSAFGDVSSDNGSIGLDVVASIGGDGQQSAWHGGNLEHCAIGVKHGAQSGPLMFFGLRTEANTVDVQFGLTCTAQFYSGCLLDPAKIVDNSGAGFERHTFIGCHTAPGAQFGNRMPGTTLLRAAASASEIPLQVQGFPSQTADLIQVITSSGVVRWSANADGAMMVGGKTMYPGVISPTQITADQNNYAPTDFDFVHTVRLRSDASRTITGLAGGVSGRKVQLLNVGTQDIVLAYESGSSTAANRFNFGAAITLGADEGITIWYDGVDSRWRSAGRCN